MGLFCMKKYVLDQPFFLALYLTKIYFCTIISIVRRPNFSSCMHIISDHDSYFVVWDRSLFFSTDWDWSYWNHQTKISEYGWCEGSLNADAICHKFMLRPFWLLNASATCFFVLVTCWSLSISKKVVISTKFKKN